MAERPLQRKLIDSLNNILPCYLIHPAVEEPMQLLLITQAMERAHIPDDDYKEVIEFAFKLLGKMSVIMQLDHPLEMAKGIKNPLLMLVLLLVTQRSDAIYDIMNLVNLLSKTAIKKTAQPTLPLKNLLIHCAQEYEKSHTLHSNPTPLINKK